MIRPLSWLIVLTLAASTFEQSAPLSPCPNVFMYEPTGTEPGRWYGVVNLSTDSTLYSLWLNIVLDSKADILGNYVGDVTTKDNIDFKVENSNMKIQPGPATALRFFVQYNPLEKTPRLKAVRLNGREICNADKPQPAVDTLTESRPEQSVYEKPKPTRRPVQSRPSDSPSQNDANPYSIAGGSSSQNNFGSSQADRNRRPDNVYMLTTQKPQRKPSRPQDDEFYDSKPDPGDYFSGGQPTFIVPNNNNRRPANEGQSNNRPSTTSKNENYRDVCGKVTRNNPNPLVVNGRPTLEGQWPWQIALYQTVSVNNNYICGGTLVTDKHIVTAAHCVAKKGTNRIVNKNTLTVYLGKHNLRTSVEGVQIKLVDDITIHPDYNASSFSRDLAILTLRESVQFTDWVKPACLWPDNQVDLNNVIGKRGSVVGWGFDDKGVATEELNLVEMPVVDLLTCIQSYSEFFARFTSDLSYCAGFRDGIDNDRIKQAGLMQRTSVCNGDSGGGMVFRLQNRWYLRGLVSLSVARQNEYRCDPSHYVIFTDIAKFLPWIQQSINN